jgi:multidrug efflux system outer membrane protein
MLATDHIDLGLDIPPNYQVAGRAPYAAPPTLDWWRGFRSRELTGLIEQTQAGNLDIAAAIARVTQADAAARIAGAALLPAIALNSESQRSRSSSSTGSSTGTGVGGGDRNLFTASLGATYEIDFWGKNRATQRAAQETAVATRYAQEVVAITSLAATAAAYFQALAAQDRIALARNDQSSAQRVLDLIRQRLNAGTASELEVAQQESLLASLRAAIPLLQQTLRQNIVALAILIGQPPESVHVRGGSLVNLAVPRITPGLPSDLLLQRPDIRQAEANLAAAQADVEVARANFFPSIQLNANGGYQSAVLATLFTPEAQFYSIAASLAQPIFQGGRLIGALEQSEGRKVELLQDYRKSIVSGLGDVENALDAVEKTATRERLQTDVVMSSRRAFQIAEQRLREGTVDLVTVLTTQQSLFQAEDTLATARLTRFLAVVSLYQALGGGWTPAPLTRTADRLQ